MPIEHLPLSVKVIEWLLATNKEQEIAKEIENAILAGYKIIASGSAMGQYYATAWVIMSTRGDL